MGLVATETVPGSEPNDALLYAPLLRFEAGELVALIRQRA